MAQTDKSDISLSPADASTGNAAKNSPSTLGGEISQQLKNQEQKRCGLSSHFFTLTPDNPEISANIWGFATFAYLDNPLPPLFKERLFVYLSRFCEERYSIARHVGFLLGLGKIAGDSQVPPQSVEQVITLIQRPLPRQEAMEPFLDLLKGQQAPITQFPESDSPLEVALIACATHVFLKSSELAPALEALRHVLGEARLQYVLVFLAYVQMAHYWTQVQPSLSLEDDLNELLAKHPQLAELVWNDQEAIPTDMGRSLRAELVTLRAEKQKSEDLLRANEARQEDSESLLLRTSTELAQRVADLQRANQEIVEARRAALNVMEDAIASREALRVSEEHQAFLLTLSDALRLSNDVTEILKTASTILGQHVGANRVGYAEAQPDEETIVVTCNYTDGVAGIEGRYQYVDYGKKLLAQLQTGNTVVRPDIATDSTLTDAEKDAHAFLELGATLNKPLLKAGRLRAVMFVHYREAHDWSPTEIALLNETAERTWEAVERALAEEAVRKSDERLHLALNAINMGTFLWYPLEDRGEPDERMLALFGLPSNDTLTLSGAMERLMHPDDSQRYAEAVSRATDANGAGWLQEDIRVIHPNGALRWLTITARTQFEEGPPRRAIRMLGTANDITERKRAEDALRASENHLAAIFTQVTVGLAEISLEGRFLRVNNELCRIAGRSSEEMLQLGVGDITHPDDLGATLAIVGRLLTTGESDSLDKRYGRPDGSYVWANSTIGLLRDGEGNGLHLLAVVVDLTERRQAEEAVRESEARLRLVVESVTEYAIITTSPMGIITGWNTGAQKAFGWSAHEILGQPVARLFTPEDQEMGVPAAEMRQARQEGRASDERWHLRKDGTRFFVSGVLSPLGEGAQNGYVKIARDLTLQREAEAALRESQARFRVAVDAGELGTWDWDIVRDEVIWNDRHFLLFGLQPRPGIVKAEDFAVHIHPEDRERVMESLMAAVGQGGFFQAEFRIVRADGVMRWMNGYGRTVETYQGRATRMCGVMFDSTERREAQEVLRRSHEELEKLVEERTHELAQALELVSAEMVQRIQAEADRALLMKRIVNTQEEERGRISRELHDNLGQHLTAVMLGLRALENQIYAITGEQRANDIPQLAKLRSQVDELMRAAHSQARELRPAELDAMGLEAALGQYIKDWGQQTGINCDFQAVGWEQLRPSTEVETTLYRVVQEALTNVARHADASQVSVVLELSERNVNAIIEDNGRGFDPENIPGRIGILGMKERLAIAGGTLDIESTLGGGTTIYARVPLINA